MKTVPVAGTYLPVTFYEDDTVETVRQLVALHVDSHPDRLFIEVQTPLSADVYGNPKEWMALFFRLSWDGKSIPLESMRTYITQTRPNTGMTERAVTREEWEGKDESLQPLYAPESDFMEWRVLGVPADASFVMPLPPQDFPMMPARIPIPQVQSLFETFHGDIKEIRATPLPESASELVKRNYYPRLRPDTPNDLSSLKDTILSSQKQFQKLMEIRPTKHEALSVVKARWHIPLVSTRFTAPRTRFEQIFYGMTLSEETPQVTFYTARTETVRHKFYAKDPANKESFLDSNMFNAWFIASRPQRRTPTLLFYRGKDRSTYDRVMITSKEIVVDVRRRKDSKDTLDEMKESVKNWIQTFDALMPFVEGSDLSTWVLDDLSAIASYGKEASDFDMHRFPCLRSVFGFQNDTFRLLRAEHSSDEISPQVLRAKQILSEDDSDNTAEYLAKEMGVSLQDAKALFAEVEALSEDIDIDRALRAYPTLKFTSKEVLIRFVTDLDRSLAYANLLRFVLTSDDPSINDVCPRRMEEVVANVVIPQHETDAGDADEDLLAAFDIKEDEDEVAPVAGPVAEDRSKKMKLERKTMATYNYFNRRLQKFDPSTFDKSIYPGKCDKPKQAVVLTQEDKDRMGDEYNYSKAPDSEKLDLVDPDGTVICPPYWCMRDEIPLAESQLKTGEDGELHCPVCSGKVRGMDDKSDPTEFTVIKRDTSAKYPGYIKNVSTINKRKMPCCYQVARASVEVLNVKEEDSYVRREDAGTNENMEPLPGLRMAFLPKTLAEQLKVKTSYETTIAKGRIGSDKTDVFRIGLGRPSKTLPVLFGDKTPIKAPNDDEESRTNTKRCSFFTTWSVTAPEGGSRTDAILTSIDDAYSTGRMEPLHELEYVTTYLKCEVILIHMKTAQVLCGFWSDVLGANSRTIAVFVSDLKDRVDILGNVSRKKRGKMYKSEYTVDLREAPFRETSWQTLLAFQKQACSVDMPVMEDALKELRTKNKTQYRVIQDPFDRIQAVLVPGEVLLPFQPSNVPPPEGTLGTGQYADIRPEDLPDGRLAREFLSDSIHPRFRVVSSLANAEGKIVELLLASGLRVPIRTEDGEGNHGEVTETVRSKGESMLVEGPRNAEDVATTEKISYEAEVFEFLMFSLSKDVQEDDDLRGMIETKSANLYKGLEKWFKEKAYEDTTKSAVNFINKVRTPCGQFNDLGDDGAKCKASSLCGWKTVKGKGVCKVRVKPIADKTALLKRLVKTLRDNDKQRALVLDERLSPFFSTILYMEMPHELYTSVNY
jgi:hypothetical protein